MKHQSIGNALQKPADIKFFVTKDSRGAKQRLLEVPLGAFYELTPVIHLGASFKSPIWFESFRYNSEDANGLPRRLNTDFDLPMIASLGSSYCVNGTTIWALDLRFVDYNNVEGFGDSARFGTSRAIEGLGWNSQFSVAFGVQHKLMEGLFVRAGYLFNTPLIDDDAAFFNLGTNLDYQHMPSVGASMNLNERFALNVGYSYVVKQSIEGPAYLPNNVAIPGYKVKNELDAHVAEFGFSVKF